MPNKANRYAQLLILSIAAMLSVTGIFAQNQSSPSKKPSPAQVHPDLFIIGDQIVQQWPNSLAVVNAPTDLTQAELGQCLRFGVISSGDDRDQLLKSAKFDFQLSLSGKVQTFTAEPALIIKQIKPQGGDFVSQALGVAGIKNPVQSMASIAASQARWCVPSGIKDGSATVTAQVVLENGARIVLNPRKLEVKTMDGARKKPAFVDINTFGPWLQAYHLAPDPAQLLPGLRIVAADANARSGHTLMAFFVAALKASPAAQDDVAHHLPGESLATRIYAAPLLQQSGYNVERLLDVFKSDERTRLTSFVLPDTSDIRPDRDLPSKMDMLWAEFFATGRIESVKTISSMLAWREDYDKFMKMRESGQKPTALTDSIMRGVVYSAAGWSLKALSQSDGVVADYVDALKVSPDTPESVKRELADLYTNTAFNGK